mgnify:CR=1 FL=1
MSDLLDRDIEENTLRRAIKANLDCLRVSGMTGKRLVEEHQMRVAETLLGAGITLIPSENLLDHQFCVSRGVYEAAKRISGLK